MRSLLRQFGFLAMLSTCASCDSQTTIVAHGPPAGSLCEVHLVPLQSGIVQINYGYPPRESDWADAMRTTFPHSRAVCQGGCVPMSPTKAIVNFCPDCRKAESLWKNEKNRITMPLIEHCDRVKDAIRGLKQFEKILAYVHKSGRVHVVLEGNVRSDSDLAELKRIIQSTNAPSPVEWYVKVIGNESR